MVERKRQRDKGKKIHTEKERGETEKQRKTENKSTQVTQIFFYRG